MKKQSRQSFFNKKNSNIKYAAPAVVILILLAGVLCALLLNTVWLHRTLRQTTADYANDVSAQLASNISHRMQTREIYIRNLADTFAGMPDFLLTEELLDRKAEYLELEDLFVVNADGITIPEGEEHAGLEQYLTEHPELYQESEIFTVSDSKVFFSAPIFYKTGERALLVGTRSSLMLQQMLQNVDFKNQGLCCIVDSDGTVIVSATDETYFLELNDLFAGNTSKKDSAEATKVLEDIGAHRSGVAQFENVGGEDILLGYDFLGINDWMLLTLVTADIFGKNIMPYLIRYVAIIGFLSFATLAVIFVVAWYYRRALGHIRAVALTDPLTGGCNDLAFRIDSGCILREHPEKEYVIIYLNIRNFKQFNERFGIKRGDELLREVYSLLEQGLSDGELLTRSEGDHFYLLMECQDEETARRRLSILLERLERHISESFSFEQLRFDQGAYLICERNSDFMLLADRAKMASAYQLSSGECRFYDTQLQRQFEREHALDASFTDAIRNREFKTYIQPKVSPDSGRVSGGEVLVRWEHPEFGLLFPGDFIPLFERNGKICDLDFYMFEETCRLLRDWLAQGTAVPLSVNLSRAHLFADDFSFLNYFYRIKEEYQIPDGLIELELTESLMLERRELALVTDMIDRIREMGFLCSLDDFGFGYSSLTMLKDLNVTTVKLDRQFFLDESEKSWMIVCQIIQLTHNLGLKVVAEGIENSGQERSSAPAAVIWFRAMSMQSR